MERHRPQWDEKMEAFRWLDTYFFIPTDKSSPDEAFDWIFMMHDDDWRLLEEAWPQRPPGWRESCAYILGEGPIPESLPLLRQALFDESIDVAIQAACSLAGQHLNHEGLAKPAENIIARLRELVSARNVRHIEEVSELLQGIAADSL